jgi:hypothetical protein
MRSIIVVAVERIAKSCGYGVPMVACEGEREHPRLWAEKKLRTGVDRVVSADLILVAPRRLERVLSRIRRSW